MCIPCSRTGRSSNAVTLAFCRHAEQSFEYAEDERRKERTSTSLALTNGFLTYLPLKKVIMNVISFSWSAVSNVCGECLL